MKAKISRQALDVTRRHVMEQARRDCEAVVYYGCELVGDTLFLRSAHPPSRYVGVGPFHAEVDMAQVLEIADKLPKSETIQARLHTHKFSGEHSETDEGSPITGRVGFLSLVLPDYRSTSPLLPRLAVYEYRGAGQWRTWTNDDLAGIGELP
jgi:hypothetical protein